MANAEFGPIQVQFDFGLDTIIGAEISYTDEGEPEYSGGVRFADLVADRLADRLFDTAKREALQNLDYQDLRDRVKVAIDERIAAKVAEVVEREVVPTDRYGNATGEPTTLADQIAQQAVAWFSKPAGGRDGYSSRATPITNLQKLAADAVDNKIVGELREAVKQATADAKAQINALVAEMLTKGVKLT